MIDHLWPAKSQNLSPLDYWFCSIVLAEKREVPNTYIDDLKQNVEHVEFFAKSLESGDVKKALHHLPSTISCFQKNGAQLEQRFNICILCICV